jgi:MFS family permease
VGQRPEDLPQQPRPRQNRSKLAKIVLGERMGREFAKLWFASAASGVGDGIALTAAPLLALSLTRDPRLIAGVTTALTLPYLLFSLPAGVLIDRVDRRRAMARVDAFRAILLGGFTVLTVAHLVDLAALYACFFLIGTCETFFRNSSQTLVPQVVGREALALANGRMMGAEIVMNEFLGPMTGGLLFSFAVSSTLLSRLRPPVALQPPKSGETSDARSAVSPRTLLAELKTGLRALWQHRVLRSLALIAGVINIVSYGILGVFVVFAREDLHVSKTGYGLLLAASAVGGVIASRLGPALMRTIGNESAMLVAIAAQSASYLVLFLTSQPLLAAAMLALASFGLVQWNVIAVFLRQTLVPSGMLGRVSGVYRFIAWGTLPLGAICGGFLASAFGVRSVFSAGAIGLAAVLIYLVRMALRREIEIALSHPNAAEARGGYSSMDGPLTLRYLRYLATQAFDAEDLLTLIRTSEHLIAAYGDRYVTRPAFLEADRVRGLESDLARFFALLTSLPHRLFDGDLRALGAAVGMIPYQIDAVERTAEDLPLSLGRADLYTEGDGFRLLEFNIVSAVGGLENPELNRVLLRHPALAQFIAESGLDYVDTMTRVAELIKAECERGDADSTPVVVITDTPGNFAPFEERFQYMAKIWSGMGLDCIACPLDRFEERSGRLFAEGRQVDIVYRYFLMEDLLDPDSQRLIEPILRVAEKGNVSLISRMDAELYGSKAMLALLSDEASQSAFTAEEAKLIDRLLPWTRMLREGPSTADGAEVDLMRYAQANQSTLVLKPSLMHGGIGVVPGWTVSPQRWRECLLICCGGPYVLQRRVRPETESFPVATKPGIVEPLALNWGVFLIRGTYAGAFVRGTADPDVGVVSRATGARVGCCFHEPA